MEMKVKVTPTAGKKVIKPSRYMEKEKFKLRHYRLDRGFKVANRVFAAYIIDWL